jgi:hypothetical protein
MNRKICALTIATAAILAAGPSGSSAGEAGSPEPARLPGPTPLAAQEKNDDPTSSGGWGEWPEEDRTAPEAGGAEGGAGFSDTGGGFSRDSFSAYGYIETTATARVDEKAQAEPQLGAGTRARLKTEWTPQPEITARVETVYDYRTGIANETVLASALGLNSAPAYQAQDPNDDYLSAFEVDHAWASVNLERMDLSLGKLPIAWGSGYVFNPTDHLNAAGSLEGRDAETPGTVAFVPTVYLGGQWALGGYMAFEQKGVGASALEGSAEPENLPYGLRLRGYAAGFDLSVTVAKEVRYTGAPGGYASDETGNPVPAKSYERRHFLGLDAVGTVGNVGVYAETSLTAPQEGNDVDFSAGYDPDEALAAAVGLEYTFSDGWSGDGLSVKAEYAHLGSGAERTTDYEVERLLDGSAITLAEDYLFLFASRTCIDFLELTLSSLVNLNDASALLIPEASYSFLDNFEGSVSVSLPFGKKGTEFDGRIENATPPAQMTESARPSLDLYEPEVSLSIKASF